MAPQDQTPGQTKTQASEDPHPPTPAELEKKASAFLQNIQDKDSVSTEWNGNFGYLDPAVLKYMVDKGELVQVRKDELSPKLNAELAGLQSKDGETPVFVVPRIGRDAPSVGYYEMEGGKKAIILVSEAEHVWTPEYVRNHLMFTNADIAADTSVAKTADYRPETLKLQQQYAALLEHTRREAVNEGAGSVHIRINTNPNAPDAMALQSREGVNYLYISEAKLTQALYSGQPRDMQDLRESIRSEIKGIKAGDTSPEGIIADRDADKFVAAMPVANGRADLPPQDTPISDEALKHLENRGQIVALKDSDIDPSVKSDLDDLKKEGAPGQKVPVYVVPGINGDYNDASKEQMMTTKEGKPFILVNEGFHQWSEEYVREHIQTSDANINASVANKTLSTPADVLADLHKEMGDTPAFQAAQRRYLAFLDATMQEARMKDVNHLSVLIDNSPDGTHAYTGVSDASSFTSREKNNYTIFTKEAFRSALTSDEGLSDLLEAKGHELTHIANGDTSPAGMAKAHALAVSRQHELLADLGAEGPLSTTHNPEALAKKYEEQLRNNIENYVAKHPGATMTADSVTDKDLKKVSDWLEQNNFDPQHPARWDLIVALRDEAVRMKEYESTHTVTTQADREAESKAVIKQVVEDIKLSPSQKALIDGIKHQMGSQDPVDAQSAPAPATPSVPKAQEQSQAQRH